MHQLAGDLLGGSRRALARAFSLVENNDPQKETLLQDLFPHTGKAFILGITGAPGSGKSSLVDRLLRQLREEGLTVGVIAVDPTSPFTGGAILGDRIRMQDHALDPGVFIRSMGTRGSLGGLSRAAGEAVQLFDAFGKELIMLETVGVGQSEIDIVKNADTTVVMLTPAGGDSVQTLKAGIMEIADVFVVNKADLPGAERTVSDVNAMLDLKGAWDWRPPVIPAIATKGEGITRIAAALAAHRRFLEESGRLQEIRRERVRQELMQQVEYLVKSRIRKKILDEANLDNMLGAIASRRADPYSTARKLLQKIDLSFF